MDSKVLHRNLELGSVKGRPAILYKKVFDHLCEWILSGRYGPDKLLPSERELCNILDVSRITIRRALSELERQGWIRNVSRKGNIVCEHAGTIIPPVSMIVFQDTYDRAMMHGMVTFLDRLTGAISECRKRNIPFNIATIESEIDLEELINKRQSLLIFDWELFEQLKDFLKKYPDYPAATCLLSLPDNWLTCDPPVPSVINDDAPGVTEAMEWLIGNGRRNIIYLGKKNLNFNLKSRQSAYTKAMLRHNLKPDIVIADSSTSFSGNKGQAVGQVNYGRLIIRKLLAQGEIPEAIVATNDAYAFGAYDALKEHGIKVHEQCTVVGFDDSDMAKLTDPPLYSIYKPRREAGAEAIKLLVNSFRKSNTTPKKTILNSKFVIKQP
jgi:DNA-binding LacI/PurR family transcriptional regulator